MDLQRLRFQVVPRRIAFLGQDLSLEVWQMALITIMEAILIQCLTFPQAPIPLPYQITAEGVQQHKR